MAKPTKPSPSAVRPCLTPLWRGSPGALNTVWDTILEPMLLRYYPPIYAESDEELLEQTVAAALDYVKILAEFSYDTLKNAWLDTISRHKVVRWPEAAEFRSSAISGAMVGSPLQSSTARQDRGLIWKSTPEELALYRRAGGIFLYFTQSTPKNLQDAQAAIDRQPKLTPLPKDRSVA